MVNPGYAYVMLFAAMTLVLLVRPHGLLGAAGPRVSAAPRCPAPSASCVESADRARL